MKLTLANKKLLSKPKTNLEKATYFKNIYFKTGEFTLSTFKKIIEHGFTITYLYKDSEFNRDNSYMKNNYTGTQFICVDVDKCTISPSEFNKFITYKPTLLHTTFSNKTEAKENLYCFHLIYCFDDVITGEDNFRLVFDKITCDYAEYVDNCAKDCHRVIFTSNSTLPNYELIENGIIYKVNDFIDSTPSVEFDDLDNFFSEKPSVCKKQSSSILNTSNNIQASSKKQTVDLKHNDLHLDDNFFTDLNTLQRGAFLSKYLDIYNYINRTLPLKEQVKETSNSIIYEDWRNYNYYEVPSKYRFVNGEHKVVKVKQGNRTKSLMFDALCFIKCIPNITKEYLVTMLINEVYKFYDNTDKELSNYKILGVAKYAWNMKDEINIEPLPKKFIIQAANMNKTKAVGLINKLMKDEEIGNNIDLMLSVEDNLKAMTSSGLKLTKKRLLQFCNEYELDLMTDKEIRNNKVLTLYRQNPNISLRKLEVLCKDNGINIKKDAISKILKDNL